MSIDLFIISAVIFISIMFGVYLGGKIPQGSISNDIRLAIKKLKPKTAIIISPHKIRESEQLKKDLQNENI